MTLTKPHIVTVETVKEDTNENETTTVPSYSKALNMHPTHKRAELEKAFNTHPAHNKDNTIKQAISIKHGNTKKASLLL